jgi:hypothetical protein
MISQVPRLSFLYSRFTIEPSVPFPSGQTAYRPFMIAHIAGTNNHHQQVIVCLDTGADSCIFPLSFAGLIGLDPLQMPMQMTGGVGSMANPTYYAHIEIQLRVSGGPTLSFKTFAGFTAALEAQGIGLLGQVGFFENYSATFDHRNRLFHIDYA